MLRYHWPGNGRELRAVVRRAALIADADIGPAELGLNCPPPAPHQHKTMPAHASLKASCLDCTPTVYLEGSSLKAITQLNVDEIERIVILDTLKKTGNNKAEAARRLNIDYKTLYSKLKKINLTENNQHEQHQEG